MSFYCHYFMIAAWRDLKDKTRPGIGLNITIDKNKSRTVTVTTWDELNYSHQEIKLDFESFWEEIRDLVSDPKFDAIRRVYLTNAEKVALGFQKGEKIDFTDEKVYRIIEDAKNGRGNVFEDNNLLTKEESGV